MVNLVASLLLSLISLASTSTAAPRRTQREDHDHNITTLHRDDSHHSAHLNSAVVSSYHTLGKRAGCPKQDLVNIYWPAVRL